MHRSVVTLNLPPPAGARLGIGIFRSGVFRGGNPGAVPLQSEDNRCRPG